MKQDGFILLTTLLILMGVTMLFASAVNDLLTQIQSASQQYTMQRILTAAEFDLYHIEFAISQHQVPHVPSQFKIVPIATDVCGNKTLKIQVESRRNNQHYILQVQDIFARVPLLKNCKPKPRIQRLGWLEN